MDVVFPREFLRPHRFCVDLFDVLERILLDGFDQDAFEVTVSLRSDEHVRDLTSETDIDILDWLDKEGYHNELDEVVFRQVFMALLRDMCYFLSEGLSCSARGRNPVAFALLRKPFKDNLFYLEWMLADRKGFLQRFIRDGPEGFDYQRAFPTVEERQSIIAAAVSQLHWCGWDAEFLYGLRYDKKADYGFEALWNQAVHLITTNKNYKTDKANFNFIFSTTEDYEDQWGRLYFQLPVLLMHTVGVCDALFSKIAIIDENKADWRWQRKVVGFLLWSDYGHEGDVQEKCLALLRSELIGVGQPYCSDCGANVPLDLRDAVRFYRRGTVRCRRCNAVSDLELEGIHVSDGS